MLRCRVLSMQQQEAQLQAQVSERRSTEEQVAALRDSEAAVQQALQQLQAGHAPLQAQRQERQDALAVLQRDHAHVEEAEQAKVCHRCPSLCASTLARVALCKRLCDCLERCAKRGKSRHAMCPMAMSQLHNGCRDSCSCIEQHS